MDFIRMIMGSQYRTFGHNKSVGRSYRCPKVLGKPIHVDKSSPRYRVDVGTYSLHWMSDEFPRFLDIIEYSTNAMLNIYSILSYCLYSVLVVLYRFVYTLQKY